MKFLFACMGLLTITSLALAFKVKLEESFGFIETKIPVQEALQKIKTVQGQIQRAIQIEKEASKSITNHFASHDFVFDFNVMALKSIKDELASSYLDIEQYMLSGPRLDKRELELPKGPLEFISDINSWLTGSLSASESRKLILAMQALQTESAHDEKAMQDIVFSQQAMSKLIKTFDKELNSEHISLAKINYTTQSLLKTDTEVSHVAKINAILTLAQKANNQARSFLTMIQAALAAADNGLLSREALSHTKLVSLINKLHCPTGLTQPFS